MTRHLPLLVLTALLILHTRTNAAPPTTRPATRPSTAPINRAAGNARITAARSDIAALSAALDIFEVDNGRYPTSDEGLQALVKAPKDATHWQGPYIKQLRNDPWNHPYVYHCPGAHNKNGFDLLSLGEDGIEGTPDDIANWQSNE